MLLPFPHSCKAVLIFDIGLSILAQWVIAWNCWPLKQGSLTKFCSETSCLYCPKQSPASPKSLSKSWDPVLKGEFIALIPLPFLQRTASQKTVVASLAIFIWNPNEVFFIELNSGILDHHYQNQITSRKQPLFLDGPFMSEFLVPTIQLLCKKAFLTAPRINKGSKSKYYEAGRFYVGRGLSLLRSGLEIRRL